MPDRDLLLSFFNEHIPAYDPAVASEHPVNRGWLPFFGAWRLPINLSMQEGWNSDNREF